MAQEHFSTFVRGSSKDHFCDIILKSAHWPRRRYCLKGFSIFSSDDHFVQRSRTILAILVEGHPRNISEIILKSACWPWRRYCSKIFFLFLALMAKMAAEQNLPFYQFR